MNNILENLDNTKPIAVISLLSEQTIPNIVLLRYLQTFLKQNYKTNIDKYLFVCTNKYLDKSKNIDFKKRITDVLQVEYIEEQNVKSEKNMDGAYCFEQIYNNIKDKLVNIKETHNIIFNITGGTKPMSSALYKYALDTNNCENVFYINGKEIFNLNKKVCDIENNLINLEEYFKAIGIEVKSDNNFNPKYFKTYEESHKLVESFIKDNSTIQLTASNLHITFEMLKKETGKSKTKNKKIFLPLEKEYFVNTKLKILEKATKILKKINPKSEKDIDELIKFIKNSKIKFLTNNTNLLVKSSSINIIITNDKKILTLHKINKFLEEIKNLYPNFNLDKIKNNKKISKGDKVFLNGGWLEEFVYHKIKESLKQKDTNISDTELDKYVWLNTTLLKPKKNNSTNSIEENSEAWNEIDVCFLYKNDLYIIECKSVLTKNGTFSDYSYFNEICYKLNTIKSRLGLFAKHNIITLQNTFKNFDKKYQEKIEREANDTKIKLIKIENIEQDIFNDII